MKQHLLDSRNYNWIMVCLCVCVCVYFYDILIQRLSECGTPEGVAVLYGLSQRLN